MTPFVWISLLILLPPLVLLYKVATRPERTRAARILPRVMTGLRLPKSPAEVDEDLFWFKLLAPLLDRTGAQRDRALRALARRALTHPVHGRRVFELGDLERQLDRVSRLSPATLFTYRGSVERESDPRPRYSSSRSIAATSRSIDRAPS